MSERIPPQPNPTRKLNPDWIIDTEKMLAEPGHSETLEKIDALDREMRKSKRIPREVWQAQFGPGPNHT